MIHAHRRCIFSSLTDMLNGIECGLCVAGAVDWASLAKQWIAQREVMGMTSSDTQYTCQPPQQQHIPAAPPPPPPPPQPAENELPDTVQHVATGDVGTHGTSQGLCVMFRSFLFAVINFGFCSCFLVFCIVA